MKNEAISDNWTAPEMEGVQRRSNGRRRSKPWPVPLTVFAELLMRDPATPYRAAKKFGLRNWVRAQVRAALTKGAFHILELDLHRAIRLNAHLLKSHARVVVARRDLHSGWELDGRALADVLGIDCAIGDFYDVWGRYIDVVMAGLLDAVRSGYIEDVQWAKAERYLDRTVSPRPRALTRYGASPDRSPARTVEGPLVLTGGVHRIRRLLRALTSSNPQVVQQALHSWDLGHLEYDAPWDLQLWVTGVEKSGARHRRPEDALWGRTI
jgi:hypothetical protein